MRTFGRRALLFLLLAAPTLAGILQVVGAFNRRSYSSRASGQVQPRPPRILYVTANGSDGADGLTSATAWRTLGRVNREALVPGDSVRLQGGAVFSGTLVLDEDDVGRADRPITITSVGVGPATIAAGAGNGVVISETDGVHITNLRIIGTSHAALDTSRLADESRRQAARTVATLPSGILVRNALHGNVQLRGIRIASVDVSGFSGHGILIDGARWFSGFRDVVIEDTRAHHNGLSGVSVEGEYPRLVALLVGRIPPRYAHGGVVIRRVTAHDNTGVPGPMRQNTGSGIVVSGVRGALIEASEAYANGAWCNSLQGGPVGIWAWDADSVTIRQNRSHHNLAGGRKDGGGFDFDGGTTNSVMQRTNRGRTTVRATWSTSSSMRSRTATTSSATIRAVTTAAGIASEVCTCLAHCTTSGSRATRSRPVPHATVPCRTRSWSRPIPTRYSRWPPSRATSASCTTRSHCMAP